MACRLLSRPLLYKTVCRKMSTVQPDVIFTEHNKVGVISLNRPKQLNALNTNMVTLITKQLVKWSSDPGIEIVYVEGSKKAFCAGGDVVSITDGTADPFNFFYTEFQMNHYIGRYKKPYIALIHGITMGGGVGLSVHGKYRIATDRSLFAMPETSIGYFPDVGGSYFLSRLPGVYGMFLGLTGTRLKGADLKYLDIATHFINSNDIEKFKEVVLSAGEANLERLIEELEAPLSAPFSLEPHKDVIEQCFSGGSVGEIISKLESDGSEFSVKLLSTLAKSCPISLCVTHALLTRAKAMSYEECFATELNAADLVIKSGQFKEGVRALLVDKDNSPIWSPSTIEQCSEVLIQSYFEPSGSEIWTPLKV